MEGSSSYSSRRSSGVKSALEVRTPLMMGPPAPMRITKTLTEILKEEYGTDIENCLRKQEKDYTTKDCLVKHKITPALRARMVDWMIEVLTNFRCDDQTFFTAVSIMDRYFHAKDSVMEVSDLHLVGVTCMYMASKYEDIYPLKMSMVFEKIAHKKLPTK